MIIISPPSLGRDHYLYTDLLFCPQFRSDCGLAIVFSQSSADLFKACIFSAIFQSKISEPPLLFLASSILSGLRFSHPLCPTRKRSEAGAPKNRWTEGFLCGIKTNRQPKSLVLHIACKAVLTHDLHTSRSSAYIISSSPVWKGPVISRIDWRTPPTFRGTDYFDLVLSWFNQLPNIKTSRK